MFSFVSFFFYISVLIFKEALGANGVITTPPYTNYGVVPTKFYPSHSKEKLKR